MGQEKTSQNSMCEGVVWIWDPSGSIPWFLQDLRVTNLEVLSTQEELVWVALGYCQNFRRAGLNLSVKYGISLQHMAGIGPSRSAPGPYLNQ